ncbi:MAG TPA: helix-turn-helix domain-containing protein [Dehalococcoidia bacterium]|nr:helix-turn-helix domain-containing protein [Dehalococcoidia bacterium]
MWTFITNHGAVLLLIAQRNRVTARQIAADLNLTERTVRRLITELEEAGYLTHQRDGRVNRYIIHPDMPMRGHDGRQAPVGDLLKLLLASLDREPVFG